jgi:p-cumate 2,3-dioxygenase beta subunit
MLVTSSFLVYRFRAGDTSPYVGWYEHRLKQIDGELKIQHKKAVLDMEALREHGAVSIIL